MIYEYKALVIDDEVQVRAMCDAYKKKLKLMYNININFEVINEDSQYNDKKNYDILLVDYDLQKGYSDKLMGDDIIKRFREKNSISKIIFYSSSFVYDTETREYNLRLPHKDIFDLINKYNIDRIAYKNNFEMMIEVIRSCCEKVDLIPQILMKVINEYKNEGIEITYNKASGEEINVTSLLQDIKNDTEEGKRFKQQIIETIFSVLLNYKY